MCTQIIKRLWVKSKNASAIYLNEIDGWVYKYELFDDGEILDQN